MTEIFRQRDSVTIGHIQSLLESEGIGTYLRDEYAATTTFPEVTPALCILEDADVDRGVILIRNYLGSSGDKSDKEQVCAKCGERSPGTFAACWMCGTPLKSESSTL